jgi:hypothetical protein
MTTIPDIKSTYKTWFTWASLTPAQQAFASSQGYSSGSVSVAIGDVVDYVTQTVASTQTLLVDAASDPICFWGLNACGSTGATEHSQKRWSSAFGFGGQNITHTTPVGTIVNITDQQNLTFIKPATSSTTQDVEFQLHLNINERLRYTPANWDTIITTIGTDFETLWTPMIRFNNGSWEQMTNRFISLLPPNMAYTSPTVLPYIQYDKDIYETYTYVNMPNGTYDVDFGIRIDYSGASYLDTTIPFILKTTTIWESQAHALYED